MKRAIAISAALALCLSLLSACAKGGEQASQPVQESAPAESAAVEESQPVESGPVDLAAFAQAAQESHEFPMMNRADPNDEVGATMLGNYYPGLTDLDLEQVEIYLATISFTGGELALVQAKNAGDAAKVKEIFQARIDSKSTDGPGNYPEEVEVWQRSAQIVTNGNYVMLVCHEDCEAIVSEFNALFA